LVMEE